MTSRRISRQDVQSIYSLLPMQKGMLFHDLASPEHQPYFRQVSFRIEGRMDPQLCERSWNELMARHESLRSCFDYENTSQLLRLVWKRRSIEFGYRDLAGTDEPAQTAGLNEYRGRDRKRGFDLRRDPLMRVQLLKLGDSRFEMVWSWPHIILDGWSGSLLLEEFTRIYSDLSEHRVPSLPQVPRYQEYLDWLAARDAGAARSYWADLLAGYESLATIPKRWDGPTRGGYEPAEHAFALGDLESAALRELASRNGVTTATVMYSLWGILLARYNDTEDVVFGSVVSGRPPEVAGIERMVGLFLNTIPVRVRIEPGATFASLLRDVQRVGLESMRHDHLSLAEVQAESAMKQGLFDHVLVFENYPAGALAAGAEFAVTSVEAHERTNYDFGVVIVPGMPFRILFDYNACVYSSGQMERLESRFRTLVDQALRNDRVRLDDLSILAPSEKTATAGPGVPYPSNSTLVDLWEAQVARTPDNLALTFGERIWSYREVNESANQVAHALRARLALRLEDRVGVLMERGEWRVIALLGILKAGGAYCPISSTCPEERLRFLLEDSGCRAVIADSAGVRLVNAVRAGLAIDVEELRTGPVHNPSPVCGPANLAYLIYTSGSTGLPKGILIEHGGFVNMILDQIRSFGIVPEDRVLQFASSSFDASLSEIFMALAAGARLVLIGEETRRDGSLFQSCMRQQRISVVTLPPSYLRALEQPEFPDLRVLITAGEPADAADVRHYAARLRYFNAYGPTEASVCASFHEVRPEATVSAAIPIGRPVANSGIWLLDRRLQPVPAGVPGEICIQGPGLARGYLNRPELNQSQFVHAPSSRGARLYRTGDLGCRREDGAIVYLGRADTQVKFHGFRIELGEIESVLRDYPGIAQAAVTLYTAPKDAGKLVAYYVAESPIDPGKLRDHLALRLPPHMVPSAFIPVQEIPRTTSGKVDRAALPVPAETPGANDRPVNDTQRTIASVFEEVLGRDGIGIHDSFLDLGGDSLKAILAVGRLRRRGLSLDLRDLSHLGSIARLAAATSECRPASAVVAGPAPLTPIQHWFFDEHSRAHWHRLSHAILLRAAGGFEEVPLRAAAAALWQHHDALRMRYQVEDSGAVVQTIGPATAGAGFETLDLRLEPNAWDRLATHANALHAGFSLATGPLFKAALCRMPDADYALLVAHHLVVDALSWRILLEDFSDAYQQAPLPPKTSSYADWAKALDAWSRSESLLREQDYWSAIGSKRVDPIPTDFPVTPHHYGETDVFSIEAPAPPDGGDAESGIQAVLLAAVARTLRAWTGCASTRVLLAGHGRIPLADVDVSRTVGWFTVNYPVLAAGELAETRRMLASVPSRGVGYGVLKYLTPSRMKTGDPEIGLNYLGRFDGKPAGAFVLSDRLPSASIGALERIQKLEFDAMLTEAGLTVSVRYCPKLHRAATISGICRRLREELALAWPATMAGSSGRLELQRK